jgi:hypothetical protein
MPVSKSLSEEAREYLALRREEELINIRVRVGERKAALVLQEVARKKAEAAAAREVAVREEEMQAEIARRTPPLWHPRVVQHDATPPLPVVSPYAPRLHPRRLGRAQPRRRPPVLPPPRLGSREMTTSLMRNSLTISPPNSAIAPSDMEMGIQTLTCTLRRNR